jgi:NarL family two-component system response regulator LiaR
MKEAKPIRVLVADDHPVVREGLAAMFRNLPDLELVAAARDGDEAIEMARALRPDVIVLDLLMPRVDGLQALVEIRRADPGARVLVVTSSTDDEHVFSAIQAGAQGYLLKDAPPETLIQAIRDVYRGETVLHPIVARKVVQQLGKANAAPPAAEPLTARELDVLKLIAQGLTNRQISARLVVSERTVRFHVSNVLAKLGVENRVQAARYALEHGLVDAK